MSSAITVRRSFVILACAITYGLWLAAVIQLSGIADPVPGLHNVFFHLFGYYEPIHLATLLLALILSYVVVVNRGAALPGVRVVAAVPRLVTAGSAAPLALVVLLITAIGSVAVMHSFALSMDEYLADFQGAIFLQGHPSAKIEEPWIRYAHALTPIYVIYDSVHHTWTSAYLPVYPAIRALLLAAGMEQLVNPLLAAASIFLLAALARRLWPSDQDSQFIAVALLASSHFLFTSMTSYAMPAHLFANLLWLYLYVCGTRRALLLAPWVGVLAMGLHQLPVHLLFAVPFLLRFALSKRWGVLVYFAPIYLAGAAFWMLWTAAVRPDVVDVARSVFAPPGDLQLVIQGMNLSLLISWQSLPMSVFFVAALLQWRSLPPIARDLFASFLLTVGFYAFFAANQGHGWGYRYAYSVLGNVALLAPSGWQVFREALGPQRALSFTALSLGLFWLVQFPLRCVQVEGFVRPFAEASRYISSLPADLVLIDPFAAWYAQDLVRNDPGLSNSPKILFASRLTADETRALRDLGRTYSVTDGELKALGMMKAAPR